MTQQPRSYFNVSAKTYELMKERKNAPNESFDHLINRLIETNGTNGKGSASASASAKGREIK